MRLSRWIPTRWLRRMILGVYLSILTFLAAHSVNAYLSFSIATPAQEFRAEQPTADALVTPDDSKALAKTILEGRLFALRPDSEGGVEKSTHAASLQLLQVDAKVSLIGTAVDVLRGNSVILEDRASKAQRLYRLNETVHDIGTIVQVEQDRVLFRAGVQEEWLILDIAKGSPPHTQNPARIAQRPQAVHHQSVQHRPQPVPMAPERTRVAIDRKELAVIAQDPAHAFGQARPVPVLINGQPDGFLLEAVNHYGFYGQLGILSGDVVKRINGVQMNDVGQLVSVLRQLKDERTIRIDIVRDSRPKTLTVDVL